MLWFLLRKINSYSRYPLLGAKMSNKEKQMEELKEMLAACAVRETIAAKEQKDVCAAWWKGWVQGRASGYRLGYSAGLFALEPQVPYTVLGMWKVASLEARDKHFKDDTEWLRIDGRDDGWDKRRTFTWEGSNREAWDCCGSRCW